MDLANSATTKEQLDKTITEIWYKLGEISKRRFPPFSPKIKYVPRWSPKLNALRKQVNALKCRDKRCKNSDLKESSNTRFKALKNLYKAQVLKAKQDSWKKFCMESTKKCPGKCTKLAKLASQGNRYLHR